jgi:catechol-2,3-dioxygenase
MREEAERSHIHPDTRIGHVRALYLRDPDGNGVELYWDRPEEEWPRTADGKLAMFTRRLNLEDLFSEAGKSAGSFAE